MNGQASGAEPRIGWYIQSAGRVWGPYPQERLASFLTQRRLTAQSLVASQPAGPFGPAQQRRELRPLFQAAPASGGPVQDAQPGEDASLRACLVLAELSRESLEPFEAELARCGAHARVRPGVWLVQSRAGPAGLRNRLSRLLQSPDSLIVVEAAMERAAWFNLDQSAERSLRKLWGDAGG